MFFLTSMALTYVTSHKPQASSVMDIQKSEPATSVPAVPVTPPSTPAPQSVPQSAPQGGDSKLKDIPK